LALAAPLSRTVPGLWTMTFFIPLTFIVFLTDHHYYHKSPVRQTLPEIPENATNAPDDHFVIYVPPGRSLRACRNRRGHTLDHSAEGLTAGLVHSARITDHRAVITACHIRPE